MISPRILPCLALLALGLAATEARAQPAPAPAPPNDGTTAPPAGPPPGPGPAAQPGYPPNAYPPPPPSGYPPPAGYAPPPGYPPAQGYPPPGYPPPPPGYPPPPPRYYHGPYSQAPATAPGWHLHDGTYVRLQLGFGYTSMSTTVSGGDFKVSGGGAALGIAIGGAITNNLIIYGTLVDSIASDPTLEQNGVSMTAKGASAGVVGVGGGLAYYLDGNVYLAGSLLASQLVIDDSDGHQVGKSDWGFTFEGLLGKEWWVSDNWGLGVSLEAMLGRMKDQDTGLAPGSPPTWSVAAFNVLFSATYN